MDILIFSGLQLLQWGLTVFIISAIAQLLFPRINFFIFLAILYLTLSLYCFLVRDKDLWVLISINAVISLLAIGKIKFLFYFKKITDKKCDELKVKSH